MCEYAKIASVSTERKASIVFGNFFLKRRSVFRDDRIALLLSDRSETDPSMGITDSWVFDIYELASRRRVGYVSLRIGESAYLYYLGHIGYRVDEPFRGHGYAGRACRLLLPLLRQMGMNSVVITNNTENTPSRRTCEKLGCELESIVPVPAGYRYACMGATEKCRYIWRVDGMKE